jgi:hypothetical protein
MELDDLRRHWRQPEPVAPPTLTGLDLNALQKGRTLGLVEKMRRAALIEAGINGLTGVGLLVALPTVHDSLLRVFGGLLLLMVVVLMFFYYRLLGTLRRMAEPAGSVRGHLATLAQGLRQLLRFYYRLTLASGPLTMVVLWGGELWRMAGRGLFEHRAKASIIVGLFLLMAVVVQAGIVRFARWYVQRLYGQHLDRLEGQLRELSEGEPTAQ